MSALTTQDADLPVDLLVLGGGTAGIVGAKTAASLGARVLLVERERPGGDCLWTGCVPSKALLAAASVAAAARGAGAFGIAVDGVRVDFAAVMAHVRAAIADIERRDTAEALAADGVPVLQGRARFTGPSTAEVDGTEVRFQQALLATGAAPALPPIPGLSEAAYLTSETVWDLEELPQQLVVLGGGSIGCELGQAFARLGSDVTVVEGAERVLPHEDALAGSVLSRALGDDGVTVRTGHGVSAVEVDQDDPTAGALRLDDGSTVPYARLLVAVGRAPRTADIGLDEAGVEVSERGFVVVDAHLRTTQQRIWAAGDLTGHPQFTHTAGVHGSIAASNAVLGLRRTVDTTAVPRVTFTSPEVAAVGLATGHQGDGLRVVEHDHAEMDRAVTEQQTAGFTRLVVDRRHRVLGATVVGPRAGESLGELTLAIKHGMRTRDLGGTIHPYPTFNDGPWNAALVDVRASLAAPLAKSATRVLAGARRWALGRADRRS